MLQHKLVKPMLPTYLSNIGETKSNHLIVQSIKFGVSTHLTNGRSSKHYTTKELLRTLVTTKYASGRKVVATPLWAKCEDETHTPKSGNLESLGTPKN
jgi:hypothetical protein